MIITTKRRGRYSVRAHRSAPMIVADASRVAQTIIIDSIPTTRVFPTINVPPAPEPGAEEVLAEIAGALSWLDQEAGYRAHKARHALLIATRLMEAQR